MHPRIGVMHHVARFNLEHRLRRRIHLPDTHRLRRRRQRVYLAMLLRVKDARPGMLPFARGRRVGSGAQDHRGPTDTSQLQQATPTGIRSAIACEPANFVESRSIGTIEVIRLVDDDFPQVLIARRRREPAGMPVQPRMAAGSGNP
ncbi:hypothetical protein D9M69_611430 [compost metagenome]